jgi:hypothetical protein
MKINLKVGSDEKGRPVLRSVGPHKNTWRIYSSVSAARRAKSRLENQGEEAIKKFHFG